MVAQNSLNRFLNDPELEQIGVLKEDSFRSEDNILINKNNQE